MTTVNVKFSVGQLVHHKKFDYRGVVVDVDPRFQGTEEWYEQVAKSRPPKDKPWYHVLVHEAGINTYVAERHWSPTSPMPPSVILRWRTTFPNSAAALTSRGP